MAAWGSLATAVVKSSIVMTSPTPPQQRHAPTPQHTNPQVTAPYNDFAEALTWLVLAGTWLAAA